jgi:hypothetical protein
MATHYNNVKSMKSCSIGTIIPWAGNISSIPPGWLKCDGATISPQDFPLLYEIIGTRYGGDGITFNLPQLLSKAIADFHPNHQNISGLGMSSNFAARIGTDTANSTAGTVSNIDLRFGISTRNTFSASVTGIGINPPSYGESVSIIPRLMGDHHMGGHSHTSQNGYSSVGPASQWVERCQGGELTNCGFFCPDDCENVSFYTSESNSNAEFDRSSYVIPESASGNNLGYNLQSGGASRNEYATGQLEASNISGVRNFLQPSDDTLESNNTGNGGRFGYPVALNHPEVNFVSRALGHTHDSVDFTITIGSVRTPNTISINTIGTGNVTPINEGTEQIATIRVDNIDTPSLSIIHIIRAY